MISAAEYRPAQPFFELSTDNYVSRLAVRGKKMAQYYSFTTSDNAEKSVIAVPDGTIDILFHCSGSTPQAMICGSVKKGKEIEFNKGDQYFGARFYPGAANQIFNCPIDQFTDKEILLNDVQKKADDLTEKICMATSFDQRVKLFEQFYRCSQQAPPTPALVNHILNQINRHNGDIRIQDLADDSGYSTRYLNNTFKKHVGIAPKLFTRIVRFQRCFGQLRQQRSQATFTDLALDAGYYDQAHFINEFKEFSLLTPSQAQSATKYM